MIVWASEQRTGGLRSRGRFLRQNRPTSSQCTPHPGRRGSGVGENGRTKAPGREAGRRADRQPATGRAQLTVHSRAQQHGGAGNEERAAHNADDGRAQAQAQGHQGGGGQAGALRRVGKARGKGA